MRRILLMVRKDLVRKMRAPLGIAVTLSFPIAFSAIIAVSFSGGSVPRARILVENLDDGLFGNALISALDSNEVAEYFDVEVVNEGGFDRIARGDGSALLRIPENFTVDLIEGTPIALELVRNPAQGIMPEVAEQTAGVLVEVVDAGSRVLRGPLDAIAPFMSSKSLKLTDETVAAVAVAINGIVNGSLGYLDPVVIDFESVDLGAATAEEGEEEEDDDSPAPLFSIFLFVFPGVSVWSLFMVGDIAMRDIMIEFEAGTLRRQLQGPIRAGTLIAAKIAFTGTLCMLALVILTVIGAFAADRSVDFLAYAVLSLALVLAITGAGATIYGAAGRQGRGATISSVLYLALAFAGGSFIQLDALPGALRAIAPISPFYWGTEGFRALLNDGGLADVRMSVAVLSVMGIVLAFTGASLLKRRVARGGAA